MKRTLLAILSSAILATPAFALVGGPFDNNLFYGNDISGTYQAVLTGKNISGIMLFGTTPNSSNPAAGESQMGTYGNGGRGIIFVEGYMVVANVSAVANVMDRQISVAIDGSRNLQDFHYNASRYVYVGNPPTEVYVEQRAVLEGAITVAGMLNAKFSRTFPSLEFRGKGDLTVELGTPSNVAFDNGFPYYTGGQETYSVHWNGIRTGNSSPLVVGTLPEYQIGFYYTDPVIVQPTASPTP